MTTPVAPSVTVAGLVPPPSLSVPIAQSAGSLPVFSPPCILTGTCLYMDPGASPSQVFLISGSDGNGAIIALWEPAAAQTVTLPLGPGGVYCPSGLYLKITGTTVIGAVFLIPVTG